MEAGRLGNSSRVTIGMPVLALGNAQGEGGVTPTAGIINALDRSINSGSGVPGLITQNLHGMEQTSAQVGPGDDGGALADSDGQVIGMITTANTSSGEQSTIGFAIPIDTAMAIAREISNGQASPAVYLGEPGLLGVELKTSTSRDPSGAVIVGVIGGTPASRAGLVAGDAITVDGLAEPDRRLRRRSASPARGRAAAAPARHHLADPAGLTRGTGRRVTRLPAQRLPGCRQRG